MRHRIATKKLSKSKSHRLAMMRNAMTSLIRYGHIKTTLAKAKFYQPNIEKLVTRAQMDTVHERRQVAKYIQDKDMLNKLFVTIAPLFRERQGGYTRIVKLGPRQGDAAEMVVFQFVEDIHQEPTTQQANKTNKNDRGGKKRKGLLKKGSKEQLEEKQADAKEPSKTKAGIKQTNNVQAERKAKEDQEKGQTKEQPEEHVEKANPMPNASTSTASVANASAGVEEANSKKAEKPDAQRETPLDKPTHSD